MSGPQNIAIANIEIVLNPIESSKGLPNSHYISNEVYGEEKQAIMFNNWAGVEFGKNVPEPGDVKPIDFMGIPLLIIRDQDGSIGVFQNTCRHRGMRLVNQPTRIRGVISCPYHAWCYSIKGELRGTPHVGGPGKMTHDAINKDQLGLFRFRSYVWKDIIFVNISDTAPEFEDYAAKLIERWQEFEQPVFHGGEHASITIDVNSNWKLAVENYSESYHLPWIHPGLNSYSRIEDHYNIVETEFGGQGTNVYQQYINQNGIKFPDFKNLSEKWNKSAEYITIFPNVMLGIHRDHFYAILLEPLDVENTRERVEIYYAEDLSEKEEYQSAIKSNTERWKLVFEEDIFVVEGMQKSRHGPLFDGGVFSPVLDNATHGFHQWVAKLVQDNRSI
ncbi:MAG: choline monooxygenase [Gammaproteobacteria bacterium]|jgi:choline monooxygenase